MKTDLTLFAEGWICMSRVCWSEQFMKRAWASVSETAGRAKNYGIRLGAAKITMDGPDDDPWAAIERNVPLPFLTNQVFKLYHNEVKMSETLMAAMCHVGSALAPPSTHDNNIMTNVRYVKSAEWLRDNIALDNDIQPQTYRKAKEYVFETMKNMSEGRERLKAWATVSETVGRAKNYGISLRNAEAYMIDPDTDPGAPMQIPRDTMGSYGKRCSK